MFSKLALGRRPRQRFGVQAMSLFFFFAFRFRTSSSRPAQLQPSTCGRFMRNPGVICYQSTDHWILVIIGICGILAYPVATWPRFGVQAIAPQRPNIHPRLDVWGRCSGWHLQRAGRKWRGPSPSTPWIVPEKKTNQLRLAFLFGSPEKKKRNTTT